MLTSTVITSMPGYQPRHGRRKLYRGRPVIAVWLAANAAMIIGFDLLVSLAMRASGHG